MSATCVSALCFVFLFVLMRFAVLLRADTQVRPYERRKPYRSGLISRGCPFSRWTGSGQAQGPVPTAPEAESAVIPADAGIWNQSGTFGVGRFWIPDEDIPG